MLSLMGWINGVSVVIFLVISCISGGIFIYLSKKSNAKLLSYYGYSIILIGIWQLFSAVDFFHIIITGKNTDFPSILHFLLSWMWSYLSGIVFLYVTFELLIPKKKWYAMSVYIILYIIYCVFSLIDPHNNIRMVSPRKPGEDLIEGYVVFGSPVFITSFILVCSILVFGGFGIYFKSLKSSGILKKKLRNLSIGNIINILLIAIWPVFGVSIFTFLFRVGLICNFLFFYIALREEPIEPKKKPPKKEIKVEEALFRVSERPDHISEEEITYYKEQEICLVCKGRVDKFSYICQDCRALYCEHCARALINLENACWVCNAPIDESKPIKLYKKEEVEVLESEKYEKSKEIKKKNSSNKQNQI